MSSRIDKPVINTIGYPIGRGSHEVTDFDWSSYPDFAGLHFAPNDHGTDHWTCQ